MRLRLRYRNLRHTPEQIYWRRANWAIVEKSLRSDRMSAFTSVATRNQGYCISEKCHFRLEHLEQFHEQLPVEYGL